MLYIQTKCDAILTSLEIKSHVSDQTYYNHNIIFSLYNMDTIAIMHSIYINISEIGVVDM